MAGRKELKNGCYHSKRLMSLAQKGFTLVELMVVVTIIGILMTIGIPRINRFIAESRQSEAKINLGYIHSFNKNFFTQYAGYTTAFSAMGYIPEGDLRYNIGFQQAAAGPTNYTTLTTLTYGGATNTKNACQPVVATALNCRVLRGADDAAPLDLTAAADGTLAGPGSFIAPNFSGYVAAAQACLIFKDASATIACNSVTTVDSWAINQDKNLRNVVRRVEE